jgi:hypothetical protein
VRVEPGTVASILPKGDELSRLWLSMQSLPLWPCDRAVLLTVDPRDVGHAPKDDDFDSTFPGAAPTMPSPAAPTASRSPRYKIGDYVSAEFTVFPKPDFAAIWPHGDAGTSIGFDDTGFCRLPIESIHEKPSRVRVLVNRFQEGWHKALVSCDATTELKSSTPQDHQKIRGFGAQSSGQPMAKFLQARLATLRNEPPPADPAAPAKELPQSE